MSSDYFSNHARGARFPWSIYHRPLEASLASFLGDVARAARPARVLVVGAGYLHELPIVPASMRLTAVDIDPRVVDHLSRISDPRLERCVHVSVPSDLGALGTFDAIYAKEVIEHVLDVEPYVLALVRLLQPGGRIWLSTPNYGDPWLPLLESTVLEAIGRLSGYSRRDIHPTRFSTDRLAGLLTTSGLSDVQVSKTPFRLALVGTGRSPGAPRPG